MVWISPDEGGYVGDRRGRKPKNSVNKKSDVIKYSNDFTYEDFERAMYFKSRDKSHEKHTRLCVNEYCHNLYQCINESGLIRYSRGDVTLMQVFITIGAISLCNENNIALSQSNNFLKVIRNETIKLSIENKVTAQLNSLSKYIDIYKSDEVLGILSQYSESNMVANAYFELYKHQPNRASGGIEVYEDVVDMCNEFLNKELNINFFYGKKTEGNISRSVTISGELTYLLGKLKRIYGKKAIAGIVRICFNVGMRIFANLISKKLIKIDCLAENNAISSLHGLELKYFK